METILLEAGVYVRPPFPVEFSMLVDGKAIRVAINWPTIERLIGRPPIDEKRVRDFLHANRQEIMLAIKAHLFAQGVPLSGELIMLPEDFDAIHPL